MNFTFRGIQTPFSLNILPYICFGKKIEERVIIFQKGAG
jgi:hypothetical protein